jgi:hypothetical protein
VIKPTLAYHKPEKAATFFHAEPHISSNATPVPQAATGMFACFCV